MQTSFVEIESNSTKSWRVIKTQVLKHLPGPGKGKKKRSEGDVRTGVTAEVTSKKKGVLGSFRETRWEEVTR